MDETTLGSFPAAKILIDILNRIDKKHLSHKVCSAISDYKNTIDEINKISDCSIRKKLLFVWRNEGVSIIETMKLPDNVKSFMRNIESKIFRESMKGL
jgi:adenylosuccinate synthase